jgi:tungstate transport system ATP-binding protein
MPLYELKNIIHHYHSHPALAPALEIDHWQLESGRITGLFGPNGSGKSTLLKLLGFVDRPTVGQVYLDGRKTAPFDPAARQNVTLLPQTPFLLQRSVGRNVAYGLRLRGINQEVAGRLRESMSLVGLEYDCFAKRPWYALSGGEAHRVALAARLALRPKVLLLDEPTTSVDAASAQHIKAAALHVHRQWGSSVIVASHEIQWLQDICHEIYYMFQGRMLGQGHRTLLFGPWHPLDNGLVQMPLGEEQRFVAAQGPAGATPKVAAVASERLALHSSAQSIPADQARLQGVLTSLHLDQATGLVNASVRVGHTLFSGLAPPDHGASAGICPGCLVWIAYSPQAVMWY